MNKKIFNAIWIVAIVVFLASLTFIMSVSYNYFSGLQLKQLRTEAELASQGVSMSGMDYLNGLEAKDYRITWIDADGTVLFDNAVNANEMENHLEREEINLIRQAAVFGHQAFRRVCAQAFDRPDGSLDTAFRIRTANLLCDSDSFCSVICACVKYYKVDTETDQQH